MGKARSNDSPPAAGEDTNSPLPCPACLYTIFDHSRWRQGAGWLLCCARTPSVVISEMEYLVCVRWARLGRYLLRDMQWGSGAGSERRSEREPREGCTSIIDWRASCCRKTPPGSPRNGSDGEVD